ncbi:MAG: hypothetical protein HY721_29060 [Planctomycetes bacterium]|nr:hypothetical protein [Planctomycetota bacterium]
MSRLVHSSRGPVLVRGARVRESGRASAGASDVLLSGGRIVEVGGPLAAPSGATVVDGSGLWLLPGWIDLQLNDIDWLRRGARSPEEHAARVREVAAYQAARGVTGFVLATLAAPPDEIVLYLQGMRRVLDEPLSPADGAFLGALVEGTFMNPALSGAQNPSWVFPPGRALLDRFLDTGAVRLVNLAPERSEDALELIAHATRRGAVVGAGHAKPHAERLREAVRAGLRYAIHLGNGPTGSSLKRFHDGGMLEEALRNDAIAATVILDGWHVHPELVRDWIARKEVSRVIAVSDAGFAMEVPRGEFEVFGVRGEASPDGRYLRVVPRDAGPGPGPSPLSSDTGALFGSAVHMRDVFENALNLLTREMAGVYTRRHPALPLEEALAAASALCSRNAASLLGLADRGEIAAGRRGDVVLAGISGGPGAYAVEVVAVCAG